METHAEAKYDEEKEFAGMKRTPCFHTPTPVVREGPANETVTTFPEDEILEHEESDEGSDEEELVEEEQPTGANGEEFLEEEDERSEDEAKQNQTRNFSQNFQRLLSLNIRDRCSTTKYQDASQTKIEVSLIRTSNQQAFEHIGLTEPALI